MWEKTVNERYIIISMMLPATIVSSQLRLFSRGGVTGDEDAGEPEVICLDPPGNLQLGLKRALQGLSKPLKQMFGIPSAQQPLTFGTPLFPCRAQQQRNVQNIQIRDKRKVVRSSQATTHQSVKMRLTV
jgi:hypothetical protein